MNDFVRDVSTAAKIGRASLLRRMEMDRFFEAHVLRIKKELGLAEPFIYPQVIEHHLNGDPIVTTWQYLFAPKSWDDGPLLLGVVSRRGAQELLLTLVDRSAERAHVSEYIFDLDSHLDAPR